MNADEYVRIKDAVDRMDVDVIRGWPGSNQQSRWRRCGQHDEPDNDGENAPKCANHDILDERVGCNVECDPVRSNRHAAKRREMLRVA